MPPRKSRQQEIAQAVEAALAQERRAFHSAGGRARMATLSQEARRAMARKGAVAANAVKAAKRAISGRATE
jgi:hypothetical protein